MIKKILALIYLFVMPCLALAYDYQLPLKISANSRYLVDQNNQPFLLNGDTAWSLIAQLSKADADTYISNRQAKGFNMTLVNLIEHQFASNAPRNNNGDAPFTGKNFTTPNEAYFVHADYVVNSAAAKGIVVLLAPLYLGYGCGSEGWCSEIKSASTADLQAWGQYVGNRYKNFNNIIWLIGGDTDPTQVKDKVLAFVTGLTSADTRHLITAHNQPESYAISPWSGQTWLNINDIYTYSSYLYSMSDTAYSRTPIMPFFELESAYENEHSSTAQSLRATAYWTILSGGMGHTFGNCPIWHLGSNSSWCGSTNWKSNMDAAGSVSMMYLGKLFNSRSWHLLVPDTAHTVMTAGYGSSGNQATTERASDGSTIISYLPNSRAVTINMTKVGGTEAKAWWYNPSTGAAALIGTYANTGTQTFTPAASGDWVLVVDNSGLNLPAPGTSSGPVDTEAPAAPKNVKVN
jgi:hypothetical protein